MFEPASYHSSRGKDAVFVKTGSWLRTKGCFFALDFASITVVGCSQGQEQKEANPVVVSVVALEATEGMPLREFVARTAASAGADITPRIEAEIRDILFIEGARNS